MPAENKPLEMSVLKRVKELLAEVDARTAAKHITMVDCRVRTEKHTHLLYIYMHNHRHACRQMHTHTHSSYIIHGFDSWTRWLEYWV